MRGAVVLHGEASAVMPEAKYVTESRCGEGLCWRRRKRVAPILDASRSRQVLLGVFMRRDGRPRPVEPGISVRVINVPMGID